MCVPLRLRVTIGDEGDVMDEVSIKYLQEIDGQCLVIGQKRPSPVQS